MDFPRGQYITLGVPDNDGCVELYGVEGRYGMGDCVPLSALDNDIAALIPTDLVPAQNLQGILGRYHGPIKSFYPTSEEILNMQSEQALDLLNSAESEALNEALTIPAFTPEEIDALLGLRESLGGEFSTLNELVEKLGPNRLAALIKALTNRPW